MDGWKGKGLRVVREHHFLVFPARPDRIDGRMALWVLGWFWAETTTCEIIDADVRFFFSTFGFVNKACSCGRRLHFFFLSL